MAKSQEVSRDGMSPENERGFPAVQPRVRCHKKREESLLFYWYALHSEKKEVFLFCKELKLANLSLARC